MSRLPMPLHAHPAPATRRSFHAAALGLLLLAASFCQPALAAPNATYSKDGVSFEHPAGWKVTEDTVAQDETRLRSIDLEGPDDAVVTFNISPYLNGQNIEAFAATIAKSRNDSEKGAGAIAQQLRYSAPTTAPLTRNVAGQDNKGVSQRFVISLLGQKLPHEARFFKANLGGTTAIVMTQVAEEYAKATEPGFTLVLKSLRYSVGR
ncbi:hypothetical protein [Acidovorax sp.]|uniref:hypothetical protein n=1 Tax=Acidovorax sp. TaxID=1872122 RepID=UPI00391F4346